MQHAHRTDLLSGYLDRELSPVETLQVERQLASCERCQEIYTQYEQINIRLRRAYLRVKAPTGLAERILALSKS
jgi:anti-sigma factor RsiW